MKLSGTLALPILFVSLPSAQADRTEAALRSMGLSITRADNVCIAEMFAEAQHFEATIYDHSLSQQEQVSLARVMRIRWPWIRIIRRVSSAVSFPDDAVFDCSAFSDTQLADCVERSFPGRSFRPC
jgi:hypothetical protein